MDSIKSQMQRLRHRASECVQTKSGALQGFVVQSKKGPVNVFLGVPFAKPPVGPLRFKKTEPVEPWDGVKICTKYRKRAPQIDFLWDKLELRTGKSEDCLYLNIVAPTWKPPPDQPNGFPVMFYIHGGGFLLDSAVKYHYWDIARHRCVLNVPKGVTLWHYGRLLSPLDVIVVTIQYRLGYLGYFSTADENCIGNFGLWDQVTALKWVSENIEYFGGDPKKITVAGQSAGAASADLLSLSPYSRDLFHQLILMGGNAECHWAVTDPKVIYEYCLKHARKIGWRGTDNAEMMEFLRNLPDNKFGDTMIGNQAIFDSVHLPLTPVIDGDLLPASPRQLRDESQPKPTIIGVTESEGLLFTAIGRMACNRSDVERGVRVISEAVEGSGHDAVNVVRHVYEYEQDKTYSRKAIKTIFMKMLDDVVSNFACSTYTHLMVRRNVPVYMFSFEHCNPHSYGFMRFLMPFSAATHATELNYLFNANIFVMPYKKTRSDRLVTDIMTTLWTNFVKTGDPNKSSADSDERRFEFEWEPASEESDELHLCICERTGMRGEFKNGRMQRLRGIFGTRTVRF